MKKISKLSYLKDLVKTANDLDRKGLYKEADVIDSLILKMSNLGMLGAALPEEGATGPRSPIGMPEEGSPELYYPEKSVGGYKQTGGAWTAPWSPYGGDPSPNAPTIQKDVFGGALNTKTSYTLNGKKYAIRNDKLVDTTDGGLKEVPLEQARTIVNGLINSPTVAGLEVKFPFVKEDVKVMKEFQRRLESGVYAAPSGSVTAPVAKTAPKPSTPVISRNNRDYIFLDNDFKYAYQFGDKPGTYKAFAVSTGKFLGVFDDRPGFEKVKAAAIKKGLEPVDMGEKAEGDLDFDSLLS